MAHEGQGNAIVINGRAASAGNVQYQAWAVPAAGSQLSAAVIPAASGAAIVGVSRGSHAIGDGVELIRFGYAKMVAGASVGAWANVAVGSQGRLVVPAASAPLSVIGIVEQNAAAGDIVSVFLNPGYL